MTTAILIYGPSAETPADLYSQAELHSNRLYLYKPWVLFLHPQFAFIASLGIAFALFSRRPALISIGLFYLLVWAITEMTQQAYVIDALNQYWRPGLLTATDETARTAYETLLTGFAGISDSMYFVLLFGFGAGTTLFGFAFWNNDLFDKVLAVTLVFIGMLSLLAFIGYYTGLSGVTPLTTWVYQNLYGVVQTAVRVALGLWLWRQATNAPANELRHAAN